MHTYTYHRSQLLSSKLIKFTYIFNVSQAKILIISHSVTSDRTKNSTMSCNGCRVLRKGCPENCLLRQSITCFDSSVSQSNATLFVSKFYGRAPLLSLLASVASSCRPVMFQSLLYEACARTINPVTGAVGLMYTGNWHRCVAAVQAVLRGGSMGVKKDNVYTRHDESEYSDYDSKKRIFDDDNKTIDLDLHLMTKTVNDHDMGFGKKCSKTISNGSYESNLTMFEGGGCREGGGDEVDALTLSL